MAIDQGWGHQVAETWTDRLAGELPKVVTTPPHPMWAPGSLLILDAKHEGFEWPEGLPATATETTMALPNAARQSASILTGATEDALNPKMFSIVPGPSVIERTAKKGFHVIMSTTQVTAERGFSVGITAPVYDWLRANPTHKCAFWQWIKRTKAAGGAGVATAQVNGLATGYAMAFGTIDIQAGLTVVGELNRINNATGVHLVAEATTAYTANFTGFAYASDRGSIFSMANRAFNTGAGKPGTQGAAIFYGGGVEDLDVSGRTWAQFLAVAQATFDAKFVATDGAYYGDITPTDPATIT